jgi:LmbE family N-acetylglucosaminyl deacetylase
MTGSRRNVDGLASLGPTVSVWAHPDDETYLAGGVYAAMRDQGVRVVCVTATRGEAGGPATDAASRSALGQVRTRELDEALAVLGVGEHHWLGHQDGECAQVDREVAADQIAQVLDEVQPQTVLTFGPDGFTGHADHRAVSQWVDLAVRRSTATPTVLHAVATEAALAVDHELTHDFGVYDEGWPRICGPEELAIDLALEGSELSRKVQALLCQASQTAGLVEAVGIDRFTAWVASECFATAPPPEAGSAGTMVS